MSEEAIGQQVSAAQEAAAGAEPTPQARERHATLSQELTEHQYRYYVLDAPTISDAEFDRHLFYPVLPGGATASLTDFTYLADAMSEQLGSTAV
ncbi:hypothetical protein AB0M52_24060, partial [Micromonospora sp. NPDC051296]